MIKEQEAGFPTADVCRKHGLSQGTFYKFKSQYGGMEVSDAAKLCAVTDENETLNEEMFDSLDDARRSLAPWRYGYNNVKPHSSLENQTPAEARRAIEQFEGSTHDAIAKLKPRNKKPKPSGARYKSKEPGGVQVNSKTIT